MADKNWKDLWQENYLGKGDCKELDKRVKQLKTKKQEIIATYLPWAIVERIFNLQDGKIEIIRANTQIEKVFVSNPDFDPTQNVDSIGGTNLPAIEKTVVTQSTIVEVDKLHVRDEIDEGVVIPKFMLCYFVNVKVIWQGREYTERYPLLSSTNQPLSFWTQADLNRAIQRAKVKAIAIVSGIGYKLYEDGDLQFEDTKDDKPKPKPSKDDKPKPKPKPKAKPKPEKKEEPSVMDDLEEKPDKEEETETESDDEEVTEDREEIENVIKQRFLKGGVKKSTAIKDFLKKEKADKIQGLSLEKIKKLYKLVK